MPLFKDKKVRLSIDTIKNPTNLEIGFIHRVMESEKLKYSGKISNKSEHKWEKIRVDGNLIINGILADKVAITIDSLKCMQDVPFIMDFSDFYNRSVPDSAKLELQIEARKY